MKTDVRSKLQKLRDDFQEVTGKPFVHFYCPILHKDEASELCRAHLINQAFPNSSREWTVQRKDVDNFYGSRFEADFIDIHYAQDGVSGDVLIDRTVQKRLSPRILIDDEPIDYFIAEGDVPKRFTRVEFGDQGEVVQLGLKLPPEAFFATVDPSLELEVSKDLRLHTLVSLIKAAHLTLFEMLGYRYALSSGGYFVGRQILGEFFYQNHDKSKSEIYESALPFFREFGNMVRPVVSNDVELQGTISDGLLHVCKGHNGTPWALIVYVRTSKLVHAILIPVLDQPDAAATFVSFLEDGNDSVEVSLCRFRQNHWDIHKESATLVWPKSGVLYPEIDDNEQHI